MKVTDSWVGCGSERDWVWTEEPGQSGSTAAERAVGRTERAVETNTDRAAEERKDTGMVKGKWRLRLTERASQE